MADAGEERSTMVAPAVTLEFALPRSSISRLLRNPALGFEGTPQPQGVPVEFAWHDTVDHDLAAQGRALSETASGWVLEETRAAPGRVLPPGCAARTVRTAPSLIDLGMAAPDAVHRVASFAGTVHRAPAGGPEVVVLDGQVAALDAEHPVCRVRLRGVAPTLAESLAKTLALAVPLEPLSGFALRCATGTTAAEPGRAYVSDGSVRSLAGTVVAGMAAGVVFWCTRAAEHGAEDHEAIHQARVAIRRALSALRLLRPAVECPDLRAVEAHLRLAFTRLGAVRDLDVFIAWCAAEVGTALPPGKTVEPILAAAKQRRRRAWAVAERHLASAEWRGALVLLAAAAALQPWIGTADEERLRLLDDDAASFGRAVLRKARRKLLAIGPLDALPDAELHALRRSCKRLRYAAEVFAPLYPSKPARRFLRRLARVQDTMGRINDMAVAAELAAGLGQGRLFPAGVVAGWAMATGRSARRRLARDWERLADAEPFWT